MIINKDSAGKMERPIFCSFELWFASPLGIIVPFRDRALWTEKPERILPRICPFGVLPFYDGDGSPSLGSL